MEQLALQHGSSSNSRIEKQGQKEGEKKKLVPSQENKGNIILPRK